MLRERRLSAWRARLRAWAELAKVISWMKLALSKGGEFSPNSPCLSTVLLEWCCLQAEGRFFTLVTLMRNQKCLYFTGS
jgi:hypothetical protein